MTEEELTKKDILEEDAIEEDTTKEENSIVAADYRVLYRDWRGGLSPPSKEMLERGTVEEEVQHQSTEHLAQPIFTQEDISINTEEEILRGLDDILPITAEVDIDMDADFVTDDDMMDVQASASAPLLQPCITPLPPRRFRPPFQRAAPRSLLRNHRRLSFSIRVHCNPLRPPATYPPRSVLAAIPRRAPPLRHLRLLLWRSQRLRRGLFERRRAWLRRLRRLYGSTRLKLHEEAFAKTPR
jgi:hypothetical protein